MQGKGGKIGSANSRHRKRVDGPKGLVMDDEEEAGEGVVVHVHPKAEELTQRILNTLHKKAPFEGHDAADLLQLVAAMAPVDVKAGVDVVKEGESGDLAYWVDTGSLTVVVGGKEVDTIGTDTVFGEVALVYDLARTATIRAKVDSRMWILHRTMFTHILRNKTIADRQAKFSFLQSVQIFGTLSGRMLAMVVDVVEEVVLGANEVVIKEGDEADSMYIIQEGFAAVSQKGASAADGESLLRDLKAGDYFGERALLNEERRSATVTSTSKIKLMRLDKQSFRVLLSELHAELLKRVHKDEHKQKSPAPSPGHRREPVVGGSAYISQRSSVKPSKLELLKQLGSGGYGRVSLVRDTSTKRVYALKRVCKAHLLSHNGMMRCEWLLREKRVLEELEHPFIVTLHDTYADTSNLFLLLGCALGGDMYRLIEKLGQVHEKIARFYAGSLTLALAHIHTHEMIYRDLKPENVLLDTQGYVKLCDFGFAKKVTDRTYTRCGTPDYTAPEMLLNQGVNQACDWWALGIMIFEMLMGFPPFSDPSGNDMATYQNITKGELSKYYPASSTATDEARALIQGLCTVKVAYRLGYLKGGASDVMAHAWFAGFDWDGLVNLTVESPWRPALTSSVDTMCFDEPEGTLSLDGPTTIKAIGHELEAKWAALMSEYAKDRGLNETSHLT
jgi:cGMP-dependent protein kinase